jgi:hypothetical protein
MTGDHVVQIDPAATTFTAACSECGASFAGRLDDDLSHGVFLCRAGHATMIVRAPAESGAAASEAA